MDNERVQLNRTISVFENININRRRLQRTRATLNLFENMTIEFINEIGRNQRLFIHRKSF